MAWWITTGDDVPIGPVDTPLVVRGIEAGKVPVNAIVCEVGSTGWKALREVPAFRAALEKVAGSSGGTSSSAASAVPSRSARPEDLRRFDDSQDHTVVDVPAFPASEPPGPDLDEGEELPTVRPPHGTGH